MTKRVSLAGATVSAFSVVGAWQARAIHTQQPTAAGPVQFMSTFVQFYPSLMEMARTLGTVTASYDAANPRR